MRMKKLVFTLFMIFLSTLVVHAETPQSININGSNLPMIYGSDYLPNYDVDDGQNIAVKSTIDGNYVYCVNPDKDLYTGNTSYSLGQERPELLGILMNGYPQKSITGNNNKDYFITNLAVWLTVGQSSPKIQYHYQSPNKYLSYSNNTWTYSDVAEAAYTLANTSYSPDNTLKVNNSTSNPSTNLTLSGSYYVTSNAIDVSLGANATGYTVSAPSGITITDTSGNSKTTFGVNEDFKVKIAKSSVTSSTSYQVTVTATYNNPKVYVYSPATGSIYQNVAMLAWTEIQKNLTLTLNITVETASSTTIKVYKYIYGTTSPLGGASFAILASNGTSLGTWNTSNSNPHTISNLPNGAYTIKEYAVPDGYEVANINSVITINDGVVRVTQGNAIVSGTSIIIYNTPITPQETNFSVKIIKTDDEYQPLSGASFVLRDSNNQTIDSWVSDENSYYTTSLLSPGVYTIYETQAPTGYIATSPITFRLENDGTVINVGNNYVYPLNYVFSNRMISVPNYQETVTPPTITITKTNANGQALTGAVFKLQKTGESTSQTIDLRQTAATTIQVSSGTGTYTLTETTTPTGYTTSGSIKFSIDSSGVMTLISGTGATLSNGNKTMSIANSLLTTQITIVKRDAANTSTELKGAVFTLQKSDGSINKTLTFGTSTSVTENLTPGTYTLTETTAPTGYVKLTSPITFSVGNDGKVSSVGTGGVKLTDKKIAVNNNQITTQITIVKRDAANTSTELKGAVFTLQKSDGSINKTLTFGTSTSVTENLTPGTYTLTETTAPTGYVKLTSPITFSVGNDGKVSSVGTGGVKLTDKKIAINNSRVLGEITIVKRDATTITKLLSGAEFKLRKSGETEDRILTFDNSSEIMIPLTPGTYTLTETKAPTGYVKLTNSITFIIDNNGKVSSVTGNGVTKISDKKIAVANNEVTTQITIVKRDSDTNIELKGAVFTLQKSDGSINKTLTFGTSTSVTETITPGTYTLTETKAPDDYVKLTSPITFNVGNDGKIISVGTNGTKLSDNKIAINNSKVPEVTGEVTIIKKDSKTNDDLTGAIFKLQKTDNPTREETITLTTASIIKNLSPGEYTLTETKAPEGYELDATPYKFRITTTGIVTNDNGVRISGGKIIIHNEKEPTTGEAVISKRDITTGEELPGAYLKVVDSNGNVIEEWISTDKPKILRDLVPGTYTLSETIAPEGYQKSTEQIKFTIDDDGKVVGGTVIMHNEPNPVVGKAIISKRDANTGKELAGAVLVLKDEKGNVIERWTTTNKPYVIDNLSPGTYIVSEEEAPKKYILTKNDITFTVDENGYVEGTIILNNYPNEVTTNVQTGDKKFIMAVIIGLLSLGYTIFAYTKYHKINAKV